MRALRSGPAHLAGPVPVVETVHGGVDPFVTLAATEPRGWIETQTVGRHIRAGVPDADWASSATAPEPRRAR